MTLSWKFPDWPASVIVESLRLPARDHGHRLGHHRIDLARHDAAARLQRRQCDFRQTAGTAFIQRKSFAIFIRLTLKTLSWPESSRPCPDSPAPRNNSQRAGTQSRYACQIAARKQRELRSCVDARADRRTALRQGMQPQIVAANAPRTRRFATAKHRAPAQVMAIASIKCVRPVLTIPASSAARSLTSASAERGLQLSVQQQRGGHVDRGRHHIIAALTHVSLGHWMYRSAERARRSEAITYWHSCCCWCRNRLEYIHGKLSS